ncbi:MAG: aldo/keto reductase [Bacillati bacterium ANGP1]|uniref:Aldo/keto reductase n=1 Tax=Candidatus Segetimicrobium genomatis TaxID=2569760 RepID=A0A537JEL3_9BACT|nr:MAG: aldo/keto reductase [Terrabacteria group bacterium ANGP1]
MNSSLPDIGRVSTSQIGGLEIRLARGGEDVLEYCSRKALGFIPWFPLAMGQLAASGGPIADAAKSHGATSGQIALAWLLRRSPVMLPIPGTSSVSHLEEDIAAAGLVLGEAEFATIGTEA